MGDRSEQEETQRDLVIRAIADLENRSPVYDEAQKAKAGAWRGLWWMSSNSWTSQR